jgi:hypothetical protein
MGKAQLAESGANRIKPHHIVVNWCVMSIHSRYIRTLSWIFGILLPLIRIDSAQAAEGLIAIGGRTRRVFMPPVPWNAIRRRTASHEIDDRVPDQCGTRGRPGR